MKIVGDYIPEFNAATGQNLPCDHIYQSPGLQVHIQNHHPDEKWLLNEIPKIIAAPDYIGKNPKETNSIELVKQVGTNAMVCIKLDSKNGYLYVASVFSISAAKLSNRIQSGRLKKC